MNLIIQKDSSGRKGNFSVAQKGLRVTEGFINRGGIKTKQAYRTLGQKTLGWLGARGTA